MAVWQAKRVRPKAECRGVVGKSRTRRAVHRLVLWAGDLSTTGANTRNITPTFLFSVNLPTGEFFAVEKKSGRLWLDSCVNFVKINKNQDL